MVELSQLVISIADALNEIDNSRVPFKEFKPGVGPYGEPQLVRKVVEILRTNPIYSNIVTKRTPDILIPGSWAIEVKIVRPFGDNGREAENWSVNLLHPYQGNVSSIGDALKLRDFRCDERKAVIVIGYEHDPAIISLEPLILSFELIAGSIIGIHMSDRVQEARGSLIHPVHQRLVVYGWEILVT